MKKNKQFHPLMLIFIGLISLVVFLYSVKEILIVLYGNQAQGTVTDWSESLGGYRGGGNYAVDVSYIDGNDVPHTFTQHDGIKTDQYIIGQTVTVYYDLDNPEDAVISASFLSPLLSFVVFIWSAILGLRLFLKKRKI